MMKREQMEMQLQNAVGSSIAAFTLAQVVFWQALESGSLSYEKAVELLNDAIKINSQGGVGNLQAAQRLQTVLDMVMKSRGAGSH